MDIVILEECFLNISKGNGLFLVDCQGIDHNLKLVVRVVVLLGLFLALEFLLGLELRQGLKSLEPQCGLLLIELQVLRSLNSLNDLLE